MKYSVVCVALGFLFFANAEVQLKPDYESNKYNATVYSNRAHLILKCILTDNDDNNIVVKWEKNGTDVKSINSLKDRVSTYPEPKNSKYVLNIEKSTEADAGVYSCVAYSNNVEVARANNYASCAVKVKSPDSVNVVEGEKLRIPCTVLGVPTPVVTWNITREGFYNGSEDRVVLLKDEEKGIENAILVVENAEMADRGIYQCIAYSNLTKTLDISDTMVRIKDKYAALWPFLGICAEVFVLCAIILIYEKKRNKTELEESDTDQSPDTKNTPDHGKEANLRHRQ